MLFRVLIIAFITYVVYSLYRRFIKPAAGRGRGGSPFSQGSRRPRPGGNAVDAEFEEMDDNSEK
ncbi:MAG: hypothetical protein C0600_06080 [Ignavibacteria bacterium]|nr:MAG: hypothetical protein C0600_06080 [Ignavibacteria bacterium]